MGNRLYGEYKHTIDKKKRMFLPSKIRNCLGENIIMVKCLSSKCIAVYPEEEWERFEAKLDSLSELDGELVRRMIYSSMEITQADAQGRILVPVGLCEYAELEREVIILGAGHRAEIWNEENRAASAKEENSPDLLAKLKEIGF